MSDGAKDTIGGVTAFALITWAAFTVTLAPLARATRRPATAAGREEIQQIASGLNVAAEIQPVEEVAA